MYKVEDALQQCC